MRPKLPALILLASFAGLFALSALQSPRLLAAVAVLLVLLPRRLRRLRRAATLALPLAALLGLAGYLASALASGAPPDPTPYLLLIARTTVLALAMFTIVEFISWGEALAPWPSASRLYAIVRGQVLAFRLVATDSRHALESRSPRAPSTRLVLAHAAFVAALVLSLAVERSREVADALRSRGL